MKLLCPVLASVERRVDNNPTFTQCCNVPFANAFAQLPQRL